MVGDALAAAEPVLRLAAASADPAAFLKLDDGVLRRLELLDADDLGGDDDDGGSGAAAGVREVTG